MPWVSSEAMTIHLAEIAKQVSANAHAMLICDGAGWHQTGQRLSVPANVSLLRLPPYAPELNPIENVWEYLRGNQLSMRVWESCEDIVEACCEAWNAFLADGDRLTSITAREWAAVKT
jgi:transposase